jgi:hypothetical protein
LRVKRFNTIPYFSIDIPEALYPKPFYRQGYRLKKVDEFERCVDKYQQSKHLKNLHFYFENIKN